MKIPEISHTMKEILQNRVLTGEQRLAWAVLENAYRAYFRPCPQNVAKATISRYTDEQEEAHLWFKSTKDMPFSFEWICLMLHVDSSYARRMLLGGDSCVDQMCLQKIQAMPSSLPVSGGC